MRGDFGEIGHALYDFEGRLAGVLAMQEGSEGAAEKDNKKVFMLPAATVKATLPLAVEKSKEALEKDKEMGGRRCRLRGRGRGQGRLKIVSDTINSQRE